MHTFTDLTQQVNLLVPKLHGCHLNERLQATGSELVGKDEELREIALPETGTYTLQVEGNIDESTGAYVITISGQ